MSRHLVDPSSRRSYRVMVTCHSVNSKLHQHHNCRDVSLLLLVLDFCGPPQAHAGNCHMAPPGQRCGPAPCKTAAKGMSLLAQDSEFEAPIRWASHFMRLRKPVNLMYNDGGS